MKHGFLKVGAVSPKIRVADCEYNAKQIIAAMEKAEASGVKLLAFPELCVTGSTCGDLFLQSTLISGAKKALAQIAERSGDMITVVGVPLVYNGALLNCAAVMQMGTVLAVVPKICETGKNSVFTAYNGENGFIQIEDMYVPFGANQVFVCENMPELMVSVHVGEIARNVKKGTSVAVCISAEGACVGKKEKRRLLARSGALVNACAYVCADAGEGESTTDGVFAAHNIIAESGNADESLYSDEILTAVIDVQKCAYEKRKRHEFASYSGEEAVIFTLMQEETELGYVRKLPFIPEDEGARFERCEEIFNIQARGLKKRLEHTGAKKLVIGISGGLDSTLALLVAVRAMELASRSAGDIITVTMPCFGTTARTKQNAVTLCTELGTELRVVDITKSVKQHFEDIGHDINDHSVTYENAQARERTQVLMDVANGCGGLVVGTGDLSELALGWATYNGDHMSMYAVNADVPKTLVRHLVAFCAEKTENELVKNALYDVLATPVSPELLPAKDGEISQKTEDIVGPYELHDFFLYYCVRWGFEPEKVFRLAKTAFEGEYTAEFILKWLKNFYRRFFSQQFKRSCMPDGPRVGSVSLSPRGDWTMPSDACNNAWAEKLDMIQL